MLSLLIFLIVVSLLVLPVPFPRSKKLALKNQSQRKTGLTALTDQPQENLSSQSTVRDILKENLSSQPMEIDKRELEENLSAQAPEMEQPKSEENVEIVEDEMMIPVVEEELQIEKQLIPKARIRVNKRVVTRKVEVDVPIIHEEMVVERIPIDRLLEEGEPVPKPRREGDTFILPIISEVAITRKIAQIKEVVQANKERFTEQSSQTCSLREEVVDIQRIDIGTYVDTPAEPSTSEIKEELSEPLPPIEGTVNLEEEMMIPVIVEELQVEKLKWLKSKVIVDKRVEIKEESIETPLIKEKIDINIIPAANLPEDISPIPVCEEDSLLLPLLQEQAITKKRLLWVEDVRISKRAVTEIRKETVILRREVVDIERFPLI